MEPYIQFIIAFSIPLLVVFIVTSLIVFFMRGDKSTTEDILKEAEAINAIKSGFWRSTTTTTYTVPVTKPRMSSQFPYRVYRRKVKPTNWEL